MILFNQKQKIATLVYCCLLLAALLLLTPYYKYHIFDFYIEGDNHLRHDAVNDTSKEFYGNFFLLNTSQIVFEKLFFEFGLLTVIYSLSLITLKSKSFEIQTDTI